MAKRKLSESKSRRSSSESARVESGAKKADASWFSPAAIRETVESVIIAFVLAFLFRTFEAEAFVIPTGSMAPTLMGKHKDLECPMCHFRYQVSASDHATDRDHPDVEVAATIYHATCPMCRFRADLGPNNPQDQSYPSYDGDRILVAKFPYEYADPKRWDIIVFKYPGNATMNYIKRLVGLPGETIRIHDGDLWIRKPGQPAGKFEIARKPPEKLLAMLQLVYDNDLAPTIAGKLGWPARWTPESDNAWTSKDLSSFDIDGAAKGEIRYRHRVPAPGQWQRIASAADNSNEKSSSAKRSEKLTRDRWEKVLGEKTIPQDSVEPQLIKDFTAYNTGDCDESRSENVSPPLIEEGYGLHWVGDLAVQFQLESKSASGKVFAELIKGGRNFQCRFDLSTGKAELAIGGGGPEADGYHRTATTAIAGAGRHSVRFANVDDELTLWVDEKVVSFQDPTKPDAIPQHAGQTEPESEKHPNQYNSDRLNNHVPTAEDLSPVRISAEAAAVTVSHLKVFRDVYYIAVFNQGENIRRPGPLRDFGESDSDLNPPSKWKENSPDDNERAISLQADPAHPDKDQFFVLGDNSAKSSDGRLWVGEWYVERELLIGKALFIYWPHGWKIPYVPLPVNLVPYFQRMHLVR